MSSKPKNQWPVLSGARLINASRDAFNEGRGIPLKDEKHKKAANIWNEKKAKADRLARLYDQIGDVASFKKAQRLRLCANVLTFALSANGEKKLKKAQFCHVGLCPVCGWRRAVRVAANMRAITDQIERTAPGQHAWLHLTLTVKNCTAADLRRTVDYMALAWGRMQKLKEWQAVVVGTYRGLEITRDPYQFFTKKLLKKRDWYAKNGFKPGDANPAYNTYHPHYHVLVCVKKSYFSGAHYLSNDKWAEMWRKCLRIDYAPSIHVTRIRPRKRPDGTLQPLTAAIKEVCKYTVKESDYIDSPDNSDVEVVRVLDKAMHGLRLTSYTGLLKKIKAQLALDDDDLVGTDGFDQIQPIGEVSYVWIIGASAYYQLPNNYIF